MDELQLYKEFRAKGEPSPLLRIAEHWLRAELVEQKLLSAQSKNAVEPDAGVAAFNAADPTQKSYVSGGGFAPGRMAHFDFIGGK